MASFERVLSGRPARRAGEPWTGQAGVRTPVPLAHAEPEDPMRSEAVRALLADAQRQAAEQGYAEGSNLAEQHFAGVIAAAAGMARSLETAVPR
ncbi:MAG: hypothetical protein WCK58_08910, partial [Chloroflexota bacterium]